MRHLLAQWPQVQQKLKNNFVCIFLDFDGTLTPIISSPENTVLGKKTKDILKHLTESMSCQVIIVSGRSLRNIQKLIGIKNIIYAGNHGLEFGDLKTHMEIPVSIKYKNLLRSLRKKIVGKMASIPGVLIEEKKFSLSLHYRLVNKDDVSMVVNIFRNIIEPYKEQSELILMEGKKVLEILPPISWNKGNIVLSSLVFLRTILKNNKIIPLYIGDDVTDEHAFLVLKKIGITTCVGNKKTTQADYYLKDHKEVQKFLTKLFVYIQNRDTSSI